MLAGAIRCDRHTASNDADKQRSPHVGIGQSGCEGDIVDAKDRWLKFNQPKKNVTMMPSGA